MAWTPAHIIAALERPPERVDFPEAARAAVAAVFTPELELILMRRSVREDDPWSGHLSFPGGRVEEHDAGPLQAAIRETCEEIGIDLGTEHLLGELDEVPTISPLPPLVVQPFVFLLDDAPSFRTNYEVAAIHQIPLDDLVTGRGRGTMTRHWRDQPVRLPRVDFDDVRLWGLTLRMVDDLLHRLDGRGIGLQRPEL